MIAQITQKALQVIGELSFFIKELNIFETDLRNQRHRFNQRFFLIRSQSLFGMNIFYCIRIMFVPEKDRK